VRAMHFALWILLAVVNIPGVIGVGWLFFGTWLEFLHSLLITLNKIFFISIDLSEEAADRAFEPFKFLAFRVSSAAVVYVQILLLGLLGLVG
jgi:hypothetical protein